jgi:predicted GNAT family acetyltransferase
METPLITYHTELDDVDWVEMKTTLRQDNFDNGRTPEQLEKSFRNSAVHIIAYAEGKIIGTARALSDGVCNAYVVDVWTLTHYRHQGIATKMMRMLLDHFPGQHVYLFTEDVAEFYRKLGFTEWGTGLGFVVGTWLKNG